ncbi:RNA polymerase sigma factor [Aquimarina litoralis]|uniref:RNA polymerase sigma factor n=1 Tax=Aquimarina litoralis TaxID=584605 RepID=UPI001C57050A|nr:sigma-70 family RNA polymerase sigma factor [Aquimarina litoralis]MBW1298509.1 sigma-70 family RNA polymerase sigma factor [Aquimarina litoralis]
MKGITEQKIREGIKNGDEIILTWFYKKNFPLVKNYILKNGGCIEDTEDIFQEAIMLLYLKFKSSELVVDTPIQNYFYGVCKNMWLKKANRNKKVLFMDVLKDDWNQEESTVIEKLFQKERKQLFHEYFSNLQDTTKRLWQLIFEGKDYQEMARITGCTENYLRKKKSETKKSMIQSISKDPVFQELASA